MKEIAISVDIETDGPVMGIHSLRSIGAVAYEDTTELAQFSINIAKHGIIDPETMEFWAKWPEAWAELQNQPMSYRGATFIFKNWLEDFHAPLRFVAWPCWFDYGWVRQYLLRYTGEDPFNRKFFELGQAFTMTRIKPPKIHNPTPHVALADAIEQGKQYCYLMEELDARGGRPWAK